MSHEESEPFLASRVLVERARQRDEEAIAQLFERYRDRLRVALRRRLGDEYRNDLLDSEDAVHDGVLAALREIDRFEYGGEGSFLAWLLRISENRVVQRLRAQRAQKRDRGHLRALGATEEPLGTEATPSQMAEAREAEERIQQGLAKLDVREREVVVLRRYLDLSTEEVREEFGLPTTGAVRALLSRAQAKLAAILDEDRPG